MVLLGRCTSRRNGFYVRNLKRWRRGCVRSGVERLTCQQLVPRNLAHRGALSVSSDLQVATIDNFAGLSIGRGALHPNTTITTAKSPEFVINVNAIGLRIGLRQVE